MPSADLIVIVALLGTARFLLALAGLDVGTSFGGIGSSREMLFASLAEPAMLMAVFTLSLFAGSTELSTRSPPTWPDPVRGLNISLALALVALIIVSIGENARIPVDNPATHLELTMVHEAMILEYSGRHLAVIEAGCCIEAPAVPVADCLRVHSLGNGRRGRWRPRVRHRHRRLCGIKLAALAFLLVLFETAIAKMRVFRVPEFLGIALMLGLLGTITAVRLEGLADEPARQRHRPSPRRLHGARELPAPVSGSHVRPAQFFALHACVLAFSVGWQAHLQRAPHLFITALIALLFKGVIIPVALRRIVVRLGIHRTIENVVSIGPTMLFGIALVGLSIVVMLPVTQSEGAFVREDLAFALSVVLLGFLMMVTRRNAVSQVIGFMSLENGLVLAATGARGMPLVVEISVGFSVLIAFIVVGIFLFRIRERFDTVDLQALDMSRGEST